MDWVKLTTDYYTDVAIAAGIDDAGEVMFTRGAALAGKIEQSGFIPEAMLMTLTRKPSVAAAKKVAAQLIAQDLWEKVPGGYLVVNFARIQAELEKIVAAKQRDRVRKRAERAASKDSSGDMSTDSPRPRPEDRLLDQDLELDAAAAAAREATKPATAGPAADLPAAVEILRSALDARNLTARWDRVTADDAAEIAALVELHGDGPLVKAAMTAHQPDKPLVFASGWLPGWRALRAPGQRLAVVADDCTEPGHTGTVRHCNQCHSEAIGGTLAPNKSQLSKRGRP